MPPVTSDLNSCHAFFLLSFFSSHWRNINCGNAGSPFTMPALWHGDDVCLYDVCLGNGYPGTLILKQGKKLSARGNIQNRLWPVAELPKIPEIRRARRDGRPAAAACAAGRGMCSGDARGAIAS
eukprot:COSAG06_NODE_3901_length_4790_cov_20.164144_3_plen_124_part_00